MRENQPITEREIPLRDDIIIVSRTDLRGVIQEVNGGFIEASGFAAAELIGQPHNIVRHPTMPTAVFADFWATLKAGRPWTGTVKNRCKNGDHYWVVANVTPLCEDGNVVGFLSLRRPASRPAIAAAERAYADIRSGRLRDFEVRNGEVRPRQRLQAMNPLWKLSLSTRLLLFGAFGIGLAGLLMELAMAGIGRSALWLMLLLGLGFVAYSAQWLSRDVVGRLQDARRALRQIGDNRFDAAIDVSRADEVGEVLQGLKSMQIRLGYSVEEARLRAAELARVQSGLDFTGANLMMLDPALRIIYANRAMTTTLHSREARLREALPAFSAAAITGTAFEAMFVSPADIRRQLLALRSGRRERLAIAGISFELTINPVTAADGTLLGFVVEWNDRTAELQIEHEIGDVVRAAAAGDFSGRIGSDGKQGFLLALAEGIDALLASTADSLSDLQGVLAALADGDLTRRITRDYSGVLAQMKQDTNRSIESLGTIIGQIRDAAQTIDRAAAEIASGNADLSMRSEQQAANLEETASSMEELTSTVRQNAESARQARELARGAADVATRGGVVVGDVVSTMDAISAASRKIEDIIGVIDGIAFQTNILALNAAVEAARAGEQGRGFAVVAAEVRSLAGRSAEAAKEIKSLIGHSVETVASGSNLVRQAGTTMQDIVSSVERVNALMGEIAAATDEQAAGVDIVSQTIMQLDEATQQNAALVEQASAAATALEEQAGELNGSISRFRLAEDVAPASARKAPPGTRGRLPSTPPAAPPRAAAGRSSARREAAATPSPEAHHWDEF